MKSPCYECLCAPMCKHRRIVELLECPPFWEYLYRECEKNSSSYVNWSKTFGFFERRDEFDKRLESIHLDLGDMDWR
ncbi:MAG: hypothetical protein ACTSW1_07700 [Candidatus Hodarchaeales archaeon]